MRGWPANRLAALGGFGVVVLFIAGTLVTGEEPPKFDDSAQTIAGYFMEHHRAIMIGSILYGVLAPLFLGVVAVLTRTIRARGHAELATIAFGGGAVMLAIGAVGDAVTFAMARTAVEDEPLTRGLFQVSGYVYGRLYWVALALVVPVGIAAWRGALPRWQAWISSGAAILLVLAGISVKTSGEFSPSGAFAFLGFLGFLVWLLGVSVALWRMDARTGGSAPAS